MTALITRLWGHQEQRLRLVAALRTWNDALNPGTAAQREAAQMLDELWSELALVDKQRQAETPPQHVDRLLDFPSHRLAVYGSLTPGKKNHHVMAGMHGSWRTAVLRGSLRNEGWGAGEGFPGFLWDGTQTAVAAQVFSSADLPHHWSRLDEFEGEEYQRILVPVELEDGEIEVCNVYELAKKPYH
jgi:gamma-glutamylcyclotransferase (GGCT)/AIG2-like uncharacterized protein YtfP